MTPNSTYPPAFVPLTDDARKAAYCLLTDLIMQATGERAAALCDLALLAGHPNYPLARGGHTWPTDPVFAGPAKAGWAKARSEGRTITGPAQ